MACFQCLVGTDGPNVALVFIGTQESADKKRIRYIFICLAWVSCEQRCCYLFAKKQAAEINVIGINYCCVYYCSSVGNFVTQCEGNKEFLDNKDSLATKKMTGAIILHSVVAKSSIILH